MPEPRPRVALVTTAWSDGGYEAGFVARRVGAALATAADVEVVLADGGVPTGGDVCQEPDGAFRVWHVPSRRPDPHRAGLLRSALAGGDPAGGGGDAAGGGPVGGGPTGGDAGGGGGGPAAGGRIPAGVRAHLRQLWGGSGSVPAVLESLSPDAVVVVDHRHCLATAGVRQWDRCRRAVLLTLASDRHELGMSLDDGVLEGWDALLATSLAEAALLEESMAARLGAGAASPVLQVGLSVEQPVPADTGPWVDRLSARDPWLVVLDEPASRPGQAPDRAAPEVAHLALRFPNLTLVVMGPNQTSVVRARSHRVEAPIDRGTMWTVMAGAIATLDLRPPQASGRETIESMLLSTPVLVPAGAGAACRLAQDANGGLWYRTAPEMVACVEQLLQRATRDLLGAQGHVWATRHHANPDAFVEAVCGAVLPAGLMAADGTRRSAT